MGDMQDPRPGKADGVEIWLDAKAIQRKFAVSSRTLARWKCLDDFPQPLRCGRTVRYSERDLERWAQKRRRRG